MHSYNRKTTPKVRGGRVRKKNNWAPTPNYYDTPQPLPVIDRERPGTGYRHILRKRDIVDFISILPDWDELSTGLNGIVLAAGEWNTAGYHVPGVVHICAWKTDLWHEVDLDFYDEHRDIWERLGVPCEQRQDYVICKWTEATIRGYQLLHIFLHELGHHHDRMTTKSQLKASRGESYAEAYACKYESLVWKRYCEVFEF